MNTKTIGERSEAHVLAALLQAGYVVLLPFGDNQRYDLVIEEGGTFRRVQVKTARRSRRSNAIDFDTCSSQCHRGKGKQDYRGQCDVFAAYLPDTGAVYLVPVDEVGQTGCSLRLGAGKRTDKRSRWAEDFELKTIRT
jgi:hypothetical protein